MLTVRILASDKGGCGHYRCMYPADAVRKGDADVNIQVVHDVDDPRAPELILRGPAGAAQVIDVSPMDCDVLVLQRPAHRHLVELIPYVQAQGIAVVCEYDDDFDNIDPRNPAYPHYQNAELNGGFAKLAAQTCDLVTVSTKALARRYGSHGRVRVLPNYVPASHLRAEPLPGYERPWVKLGYAGNPAVHPGDLEIVGDAVVKLVNDGAGFLGIGGSAVLERLGLETDVRHPASGVEVMKGVPIEEYASALACLDVGIVPLANTTFNHAKSWLKGLEYAAAGVPFVASPTTQYLELARLGVGDCVPTTTRAPAAWRRLLEPLLEDDVYRKLRAEEGRIQVSSMTYEEHGWQWLQAWSDALAVRRSESVSQS